MGNETRGRPIAFNLTQGFVGEAECAAFFDGRVRPLDEPSITFDAGEPTAPWLLRSNDLDLTFRASAVHAQKTNLVLLRSRFLQPVGTFRGTIRIDGTEVDLDGVPGVVEDQDVLW
jgi:hypothetical protein